MNADALLGHSGTVLYVACARREGAAEPRRTVLYTIGCFNEQRTRRPQAATADQPRQRTALTCETKPSVPSDPIMRCLMISMGSSAGKSTTALSE